MRNTVYIKPVTLELLHNFVAFLFSLNIGKGFKVIKMSKNEVWRRLGQVFNKIQKQPEGFCKYTEKVIHQKKTPFVVNCSRGSLI